MSHDWLQPTLERISDLLKMPGTHNCYGTPKVDPGVAWTAVFCLWNKTPPSMMPTPRIMPTMKGGLQLEWDGIQTECRVTIDPDGFTIASGHKGTVLIETLGLEDRSEHLKGALISIYQELRPAPAPDPVAVEVKAPPANP